MKGGTTIMESHSRVYTLSGKPGLSFITVPVVGLLVAPFLGAVYSYVSFHLSLSGLATILFLFLAGFGTGFSLSVTGIFSKCRNLRFMTLMGLLFGTLALYVSWVVFTFLLLSEILKGENVQLSMLGIFFSPQLIWDFAREISKEGWFEIYGIIPKGALLWTLWVLEAVLLVGFSVFGARYKIRNKVFCEKCGKWARKYPVLMFKPSADPALQEMMATNRVELHTLLSTLELAEPGASSYWLFKTQYCPKCRRLGVFQIANVEITRDKRGKVLKKETDMTALLRFEVDSYMGEIEKKVHEMNRKWFAGEKKAQSGEGREQKDDDFAMNT